MRKEVPFTTHFVGKFRELLCISILGVVFKRKTANVFLNSFDRSSFMRSLVAYFDNVDLSGKLFVFSPYFTFLSLVGHLNVFLGNILNFFSPNFHWKYVGSKVVFFRHL